eukprot:scaffold5351_cov199-Alexandrium_tamarense.AAC.9
MFLSFAGLASLQSSCRAFVSRQSTIVHSGVVASNRLFSSTTVNDVDTSSRLLSPPSIVLQKVFEEDNRPIILFDGTCRRLCTLNLALDWDPRGQLRFAALQSNVGRALLQAHGRKADDISSIVFVTPKGAYIKSDAILGITQELNPLPMLPLRPLALVGQWVVPQILRDAIYDTVADNRYSVMGKRDECRFDADGEFDDRFVDDCLAES